VKASEGALEEEEEEEGTGLSALRANGLAATALPPLSPPHSLAPST